MRVRRAYFEDGRGVPDGCQEATVAVIEALRGDYRCVLGAPWYLATATGGPTDVYAGASVCIVRGDRAKSYFLSPVLLGGPPSEVAKALDRRATEDLA